LVREQSLANFVNVTIAENTAIGGDGANGAGFAMLTEAQVLIANSTISNNVGEGTSLGFSEFVST